MKSGPRRVFRYSSTHEKEIPNGSIRRRMELHREPHLPDPKGYGPPPRTPTLRQILNAIFYYLRAAASSGACSRTTSPEVAHPLAPLQNLAPREEGTWERINRALRERLLEVRLRRDPQSPVQAWWIARVGQEYSGRRRRRVRLRRRQEGQRQSKRHILVDTEGFSCSKPCRTQRCK
jgi:transposase